MKCRLIQNLHGFAAAAGDHLAGFHMEKFMADGAVDIAVLFCFYHEAGAAFQFCCHMGTSLTKIGRGMNPALRCLFKQYGIGRLKNRPYRTVRSELPETARCLLEVAVQQTLQSLAVTGLVAGHLISHIASLVT